MSWCENKYALDIGRPREPDTKGGAYRAYQWNCLPYGRYVCADGAYYYFNRDFQPIWKWTPGSFPEPVRGNPWIEWVDQEWFYDDATLPDKNAKSYELLFRLGLDLLVGIRMEEHRQFVRSRWSAMRRRAKATAGESPTPTK
jgi:hypothetical protein